ncbi:MAG: hypothetical protein ACRD3A_04420 [Terriglobales bacterium]
MEKFFRLSNVRLAAALAVLAMLVASTGALAQGMGKEKGMMMDAHTSSVFKGIKVNGGTVTHSKQNGKTVLSLSDDFQAPQTPDPHWQVVDSKGNVYLLDRLTAKGSMTDMAMQNGKFNKSIVLPSYVKDVVKVQIWCAWAETLLGEASFQKALK